MRIGGDDTSFASTGLMIVLFVAVSAFGLTQLMHKMKNVTFQAPAAVQTASAITR